MDALQLLREDHLRVKDLFRRFDEEDDASTRRAVVDEAVAELLIHSQLEEQVFYPAMERAGMTDLVKHSEEEHAAADRIMEELAQGSGNSMVEPRFRTLIDVVSEHMEDEESEMFPRAAELGYDRLEALGEEMTRLRERLMGNGKKRATGTSSRSRATKSTRSGTRTSSRGRASGTTRSRTGTSSRTRTSGTTRSRTGTTSRSRATGATRSGAGTSSRSRTSTSSSAGTRRRGATATTRGRTTASSTTRPTSSRAGGAGSRGRTAASRTAARSTTSSRSRASTSARGGRTTSSRGRR
jgi:hemerythrin superfamily protein